MQSAIDERPQVRTPAKRVAVTTALHVLAAPVAYLCWLVFMTMDDVSVYSVGQVVGLVVSVLALGAVYATFTSTAWGWVPSGFAAAGLSVASWNAWAPYDDSGLFAVGVVMIFVGSFIAGTIWVALLSLAWSTFARRSSSTATN